MVERCLYMVSFLRNLAVVVLPVVLRLVAAQIEAIFQKGSDEE